MSKVVTINVYQSTYFMTETGGGILVEILDELCIWSCERGFFCYYPSKVYLYNSGVEYRRSLQYPPNGRSSITPHRLNVSGWSLESTFSRVWLRDMACGGLDILPLEGDNLVQFQISKPTKEKTFKTSKVLILWLMKYIYLLKLNKRAKR